MKSVNVVTVAGSKYQVGRLPADVGAFILMRMIGAGINQGSLEAPDQPAKPSDHIPTGEELVRAVCFAAFLRGLEFKDLQFVQRSCMGVVAWLQAPGQEGLPMPVMSDTGQWVFTDLSANIGLIMRLTIEVLVFNLSDFFSDGGLGALMAAGPSSTT